MLHWQDAAEGNHEKLLLKLATKGVVKLFNVIQQQQMARNEEKGRAEKGSLAPTSLVIATLRVRYIAATRSTALLCPVRLSQQVA